MAIRRSVTNLADQSTFSGMLSIRFVAIFICLVITPIIYRVYLIANLVINNDNLIPLFKDVLIFFRKLCRGKCKCYSLNYYANVFSSPFDFAVAKVNYFRCGK